MTEVPGVAQAVPYFTGNNFCSFNLPAGTKLSPTIAVGATIPAAGQWAGTTFDATGGDKVTFGASGYNSVDGQVFLVFYEPNGSLYGTLPPGGYYFTGAGPPSYTITLPAGSSGLWSAFLEPAGPAGAMLTLTMSG